MDRLNVITDILDVAEVRRRLPEVRRAVDRLIEATREIKARHHELRQLEAGGRSPRVRRLRAELEDLDAEWRDAVRQVNELGATVKDPEIGLVDFYAWRHGEMVFLCWRRDELDVTHWHGLREGFAGRRRIDF
ncbi:MAG: DUF2203 domain-containing protein [Planctomycetes bacterium]|nr:DUF2203 domain-containing protein [Planctomycetota bacterium]